MTKHKVDELEGALLDAAVVMAGEEWRNAHRHFPTMTLDPTFAGFEVRDYPRGEFGSPVLTCVLIPRNPFRQDTQPFMPSTLWEHGGPIIEREPWALPRVNSNPGAIHLGKFVASTPGGFDHYGPSPLIAAMRAFVASNFGDEVELP
jgi:hypothetical protein